MIDLRLLHPLRYELLHLIKGHGFSACIAATDSGGRLV
jgi:hypothetical protein